MVWREPFMKIKRDVSLKSLTTFRTGGPARYFSEIDSREELPKIFNFIEKEKIPFFILGQGSNVLISDKGFPGLV